MLGPWREQDGRGSLGGLNAIDVLLAHCAANSSVSIELRAGSRTGEIQIAGGNVLHAATGRLKGEDALREMLDWSKPRFGEKKLSGSTPRTITNWQTIVVEALHEVRGEVSETRKPEPEMVSTKAGKTIVVVDDTEMLLIFVEDILATADPELQITTALSASEGLREIERLIPDLVLLDYSLPDFNGDELCERLLDNERTAHVPSPAEESDTLIAWCLPTVSFFPVPLCTSRSASAVSSSSVMVTPKTPGAVQSQARAVPMALALP